MVGFGKRVPCQLLTYIDDLSRGDETQIFTMEVKNRLNAGTEVETKRQSGIIEVKKSRSKDVFVKRGELIHVQVDGQMRLTEAMTEDQQIICYLQGCCNTVSMATEIKRDPEKLPDAMLFYKSKQENTVLHSVAIMTRDLSELPTGLFTRRSLCLRRRNLRKFKTDTSENYRNDITKVRQHTCMYLFDTLVDVSVMSIKFSVL